MKKIDIIVGARPNFIKAFPVYIALEKLKMFDIRLINTGQHYDDNMSNIFFKQLKMNKPDINLHVGSGTHAVQTSKVMQEVEKIFISSRPDLVIVFGDINSTMATAIAASKLHIPIAHVEAGLRSFDRKMPEEINRLITDQISDLLFITSPEAETNLKNEGIPNGKIFFVGNTMIDSLVKFQNLFNAKDVFREKGIEKNKYILITMHRPSNVDAIKNLSRFVNALLEVSNIAPVVWPMHPRTAKVMSKLDFELGKKLMVMEPLGYLEFMGLQKNALAVITDSGGVQEESTYFGVPCLTIRENTERPITISRGTNYLMGTDYTIIAATLNNILNKKKKISRPKLWDGKAAQRIINILIEKLN